MAVAIERFHQGDTESAALLCHRILHQVQDHPPALTLLATLACRDGRLNEGIQLTLQVLARDPGNVQALEILGDALQSLNEPQGAAEAFRRALVQRPQSAPLAAKLGLALHRHGDIASAIAAYRQSLDNAPDNALAWFWLGAALREARRLPEALAALERLVALAPDHAEAHAWIGAIHGRLERWEDAFLAHERATALGRTDPATLSAQGEAALKTGREEVAEDLFSRVLAQEPDSGAAWCNLALALCQKEALGEALEAARRAVALAPHLAAAHAALGIVHHRRGALDSAIAEFQSAIALAPTYREAHVNLGIVHLLRGEFATGWREYDWRAAPRPVSSAPRWRGEALAGRTLLLRAEQGLGDMIQFARYVPILDSLGARIVLETPRPLARLLRGLSDTLVLLAPGETPPETDFQAPLPSVAGILGTDGENIPAAIPYLHPPANEPVPTLPARPGQLRVGVVWAGSPTNIAGRHRSLPAAALLPALAETGAALFSLQWDLRPGDRQVLDALSGRVADLGPILGDFAHMAAVMAKLDLIVTVDTAAAHLAGATGCPAWVLLPHVPDWRWRLDRDDSAWYPTLRLFRQPQPRAWAETIAQVATELRGMTRTRPIKPE
jgi:tetratricopeptide (TPR) repeat protein